jgi:hypothetical protein
MQIANLHVPIATLFGPIPIQGNVKFMRGEQVTEHWYKSDRADPRALPLADRHYNRQKIGSPQFLPPGRCFALLTKDGDALWASAWPFAQYVKHQWAGAWTNTLFRNEGPVLSSTLIREAVAATAIIWGLPPEQGFITFVSPLHVRRKRDWGRCYRKAGWRVVGVTKQDKLIALGLSRAEILEQLRVDDVKESGL